MEEEKNVFTAKTVDEALDEGLSALGLTLDEVDYEILEEGKKKIFGSVKAKVKIIPKKDESAAPVVHKTAAKKPAGAPAHVAAAPAEATEKDKRAVEFIDGLLAIMGIQSQSEIVGTDDGLRINVNTTSSSRVIGKRGDVLDAIQCMAGAVANIGNEHYKKVVVDCENYRAQREQTLKDLAAKLAKQAVETGRKIILEPMTPYERRVIHSALADSTEVKTASEGKEPVRYVVVIPNNARPGDRGVRYGDKRRDGGRYDRRGGNRRGGDRKFDKRDRRDSAPASSGAKRGKKEIHFGTFLGNSNDSKPEEVKKDEE